MTGLLTTKAIEGEAIASEELDVVGTAVLVIDVDLSDAWLSHGWEPFGADLFAANDSGPSAIALLETLQRLMRQRSNCHQGNGMLEDVVHPVRVTWISSRAAVGIGSCVRLQRRYCGCRRALSLRYTPVSDDRPKELCRRHRANDIRSLWYVSGAVALGHSLLPERGASSLFSNRAA